jgi:hypothetical protein
MGMDLEGVLAFGVDVSDEEGGWIEGLPWLNVVDDDDDDDEESGEEDFDDWYLKQIGLDDSDIWGENPYSQSSSYEDQKKADKWREDNPEWEKRLDKMWKKRSEAMKLVPIDFEIYGISEYAGYIICVKGYSHSSYGPMELPDLTVKEEDLRAAVEFCEKWGIPFENPKWLLAGLYF